MNHQTVLFLSIKFSIGHLFALSLNSSIWPISRTLSGATTSGPSRTGIDSNEGVLCNSQSSSITGALPWDCCILQPQPTEPPGHSLWGRGAPLQRCCRVYSAAPSPSWRSYASSLSIFILFEKHSRFGIILSNILIHFYFHLKKKTTP